MNDTASRVLRVILNMTDGKTHTFTVKNPPNALALDTVESVVDNMTGKTFFRKNSATAVSLNDAYIYVTQRVELE